MKTSLGLLVALLAWCLLLRAPTLLPSVIDWDESIYLLVADHMRRGELPYATIWDQKPVGQYLLFWLSLQAFGPHVASVRLLATLAVFVSCVALHSMARRLAGSSRVALLAALVFPAYSVLWFCTAANSEHFFMASNLVGMALLLKAHDAREPLGRTMLVAAAGLCFGAAAQIKYLALFESSYAVAVFAAAERRRRLLVAQLALVAAGTLAPTVAVVAYFAARHSLDLLVSTNVLANLRHIGAPPNAAFTVFADAMLAWALETAPLWATALFAARSRLRRGERLALTPAEWLCLGWIAVALLEASATRQFYHHYYLVTVPALCLLAALGAARAQLAASWRAAAWAGAVALAPLLGIGLVDYRVWLRDWLAGRLDEPARVAAFVRPRLSLGDELYVVDYQPIVYFLAGATAPTRFVFPPLLMNEHFSRVASVDPIEEISRIVAREPRCVVAKKYDSAPAARAAKEMLGPEYQPVGSFESVNVSCRCAARGGVAVSRLCAAAPPLPAPAAAPSACLP